MGLHSPAIDRAGTEFFLDPKQLVVFCHAISATERTGFYLTCVGGDRNISDGDILGFTGTMGDDGRVIGCLRHFDGVESFCERSDLINFHENGIRRAGVNAALEEIRIGNEQIVAHELHFVADGVGQLLPSGPVVLITTIFNGDNGIFGRELFIEGDDFIAT